MGIYYYTEDEVVRVEMIISRFRAMAIVRRMTKMCYSGEMGLCFEFPTSFSEEDYAVWQLLRKIGEPMLCLGR